MKPLIDVVTLLQAKLANGTKAEQSLAAVILDDLPGASSSSIAALAKKAGVSEPTVTRLATSLGLDGTRELKIALAQAIAIGGAYLSSEGEPISLGEHSSIGTISNSAIRTINEVSEILNDELVETIAKALAGADKIQILGTGGISSMAAELTEFRLFRLGFNLTTRLDGRLQRMTASLANTSTVVIGFSLSGAASSVVDSFNIARQYGAQTIAIAPPDTPLARCAHIVVPYRYVEDGQVYKPNSASFALMTIIDIIAYRTTQILGPEIVDNLRRIKQTLTIAEDYDSTLPLGD
ncbi:HTH-type transcriptional regulator HexR [Maritalea myrionectae]|uniref:HTH-type transcriptional regulator HexR n=1 Tax=Maritalea myrionectae TaxID=454601 RepID=A0A2R4MFW9_9HYPH|nr:MurR/RpiR family transcriptional regulator [Maritalea myrionectae]AVX04855.1 HTH-type transcriptional regulator HexR [Maritalea myrionectae]